eukprot:g13921.t1
MEVGDADFEGLEDLDLEETQEIEDSEELEELEEFGNEEVEPVELLEEGEEELECEADPLALLDPLDQLDQSTDQEAEELEGFAKAGEKRKSLAGSTDLTDPMQARYMPPHEKRRRIELAKWKEIKAAWRRKLLEEEAQGPRKQKQKAEPNMRALARRFEATLEKPGSCCFNPLQKDERIVISADGLRAQCEATTPNVTTSSGIKGLPLVAGGKYQYEVELRRGCDLTIGWSPALVLPSALASSGRSAARRMLGYSSDGELIGEGCLIGVPPFGRQGDVVSALLDWQAGSCGPRLSFMLNGRNLGMAFDLRAEGIEIPPLQPHVCQGQGRPFSILLRGATPQVPLRFPMPGYRPLGNIAEEHFSPFSKAANAYGHGAVLAGRVLASAKIDALFVSEVETGLILRMAPEVPMFLPMILLYRSPGMATMCKLASANITECCCLPAPDSDEPYFTMGRLQKISKQILTALEYVHSLRLIHCDLKPENILIKSYSRCEVKVIDFGSSCFVDDHLSSYVQSRSYRAPEVMLGLPYDQKIDLWSLGCIIAELWTGYVLFQNDSAAT